MCEILNYKQALHQSVSKQIMDIKDNHMVENKSAQL